MTLLFSEDALPFSIESSHSSLKTLSVLR